MTYGLVLTNAGAAEIESAYHAGRVVGIAEVGIGDGGGASVITDPSLTALINQFGTEPLNAGSESGGLLSGQVIINAKKYPGRVVREFGLFSETGILMAYSAYPDTYLPAQTDSIVKELIVNFVLYLESTECVTLVIDPNISVLTRKQADDLYLNEDANLSDLEDVPTARHNLGVLSEEECEERYQHKGDYALRGESYTKEESDDLYQPQGDYALRGECYTKDEANARFLGTFRLFSANGTFIVPDGVTKVFVEMIGGGGGGGGGGSVPSYGGYHALSVNSSVNVVPATVMPVTVGGGGTGGVVVPNGAGGMTYGMKGTAGGDSSFGGIVAAGGAGGAGGLSGGTAGTHAGGNGESSSYGTGGYGVELGANNADGNGAGGSGGGGGMSPAACIQGGRGSPGFVKISW